MTVYNIREMGICPGVMQFKKIQVQPEQESCRRGSDNINLTAYRLVYPINFKPMMEAISVNRKKSLQKWAGS
jgi:hypothetical protein